LQAVLQLSDFKSETDQLQALVRASRLKYQFALDFSTITGVIVTPALKPERMTFRGGQRDAPGDTIAKTNFRRDAGPSTALADYTLAGVPGTALSVKKSQSQDITCCLQFGHCSRSHSGS
jgi:hypothetical protein